MKYADFDPAIARWNLIFNLIFKSGYILTAIIFNVRRRFDNVLNLGFRTFLGFEILINHLFKSLFEQFIVSYKIILAFSVDTHRKLFQIILIFFIILLVNNCFHTHGLHLRKLGFLINSIQIFDIRILLFEWQIAIIFRKFSFFYGFC